MVRNGILR